MSAFVLTGTPPFGCNQNRSVELFYLLTIGFMTSMPQDFKKIKIFLIFLYFWFLLKSYHTNAILITPIAYEKKFSGLNFKLSEKSNGLSGFESLFSLFSTEILVLPWSDFVFIVKSLIVIFY